MRALAVEPEVEVERREHEHAHELQQRQEGQQAEHGHASWYTAALVAITVGALQQLRDRKARDDELRRDEQDRAREQTNEERVVARANARVEVDAVVVEARDALVADGAVACVRGHEHAAERALDALARVVRRRERNTTSCERVVTSRGRRSIPCC